MGTSKDDAREGRKKLRSAMSGYKKDWEVDFPSMDDATDEEELSIMNLYNKSGEEVNVLFNITTGSFFVYEYFDDGDDVVEIDSPNSLAEYCSEIVE